LSGSVLKFRAAASEKRDRLRPASGALYMRDGIEARRAETWDLSGLGTREPGPASPGAPCANPSCKEGYPVKVEEHTQGVGAIVTNLQALETVLRYFLAKMNNEDIQFPKVGDKLVKLSYLTRFMSLGKLIKTYTKRSTPRRRSSKWTPAPSTSGTR
jgi:hypothetical protein